MGTVGLPPDGVAWAALGLAVILVFVAVRRPALLGPHALTQARYQALLAAVSLAAAALSLGYVAYYLRYGPRIIDATAYLLEARGFASGHLTLQPLPLTSAQRGRFLYFDPTEQHLSVLFPPGYPALLAASLWLGSPFILGACLAAALVWFTAKFTERLFEDRAAALFAAALSATNVCLRYHTADTMSHGLSALLVLLSLYGAIGSGKPDGAFSGLALGWLLATRPVTALAVGSVIAIRWVLVTRRRGFLVAFLMGLLPGTALWLTYQWASTGSPWSSTQLAYYAAADGPPGCFRYGFGQGIGCLFEHGSYVAKRLPQGFGWWQATYVTLLRLRWHALDALNVELLYPLVLWGMVRASKHAHARYLTFAIITVFLAYVPFYFDGSYPGGGARLLADVLPLEHVLVAGLVVSTGFARWLFPLSFAGFALHGAFGHKQLRERDGGRPMFEPQVLSAHNVRSGLIFVDTDHGFLLGHDPAITDAKRAPLVVRHRGDAHDRILWERLGRPPTYHYRFDPMSRDARPSVIEISPTALATLRGFEAEAQWPPLSVSQGWVMPVYPPNDCTSQQRGLSLEPVNGRAQATLTLSVEKAALSRLRVAWVARKSGHQRVTLSVGGRTLFVDRDAPNHQCFESIHEQVRLDAGEQTLSIETGPLGIVIDRYLLE